MRFVKNRILFIASAIIVLLLVAGFYVFGSLSKKTESVTTVKDVPKPVVNKKTVEKVELANPLTSSPATGPEALIFFLLVPVGIFGWNLRKYPKPPTA